MIERSCLAWPKLETGVPTPPIFFSGLWGGHLVAGSLCVLGMPPPTPLWKHPLLCHAKALHTPPSVREHGEGGEGVSGLSDGVEWFDINKKGMTTCVGVGDGLPVHQHAGEGVRVEGAGAQGDGGRAYWGGGAKPFQPN